MSQPGYCGGGRGVRAIAVETSGDSNLAKKLGASRAKHRLALRQVGASDKDRGAFFILGRTGKDCALHQAADIGGRDIAVRRDVVGAAVVTDDVVKYRGVRVCVELIKQLFHAALYQALSGYQMLRLAGDPGIDIVNQLVGKELHGAVGRPCDW